MLKEKLISDSDGKKDITIEDIRSVPGLENYSDEQLQENVDSIKELALILYRLAEKGGLFRE